MTNYNERCRFIAEQMAEKWVEAHDTKYQWCFLSTASKKKRIKQMLPLAEIAVQFGADMYKIGFVDAKLKLPATTINNYGLVKPNDDETNMILAR